MPDIETSVAEKLSKLIVSKVLKMTPILRICAPRLMLLSLLMIVTLAPSAYAQNIRVATFAAPPKIMKYMADWAAAENTVLNSDWSSLADTDLLLVTTENVNEVRYLPAFVFNAFQQLTSVTTSHTYKLSKRDYPEELPADVKIIVFEEMEKALVANSELNGLDLRELTLCASAASAISKRFPKSSFTWQDVVDECREFING